MVFYCNKCVIIIIWWQKRIITSLLDTPKMVTTLILKKMFLFKPCLHGSTWITYCTKCNQDLPNYFRFYNDHRINHRSVYLFQNIFWVENITFLKRSTIDFKKPLFYNKVSINSVGFSIWAIIISYLLFQERNVFTFWMATLSTVIARKILAIL